MEDYYKQRLEDLEKQEHTLRKDLDLLRREKNFYMVKAEVSHDLIKMFAAVAVFNLAAFDNYTNNRF